MQFFRQKGRRKPVYVTRADNASTTTERLRGFKDGLLEQNLPYDPSRIVHVRTPHVEGVTAAAYQQFLAYLDRERDTDAIVCSDEMVASGVFEALDERRNSLKVQPIVGGMGCIKNLHVLRGHPYALLEYETHRLGHQAAAMMLRGELPETRRKRQRTLPPRAASAVARAQVAEVEITGPHCPSRHPVATSLSMYMHTP